MSVAVPWGNVDVWSVALPWANVVRSAWDIKKHICSVGLGWLYSVKLLGSETTTCITFFRVHIPLFAFRNHPPKWLLPPSSLASPTCSKRSAHRKNNKRLCHINKPIHRHKFTSFLSICYLPRTVVCSGKHPIGQFHWHSRKVSQGHAREWVY